MKKNHLLYILLFALTIFLSTYCYQHNPSSWFDEGIYIQIANNLYDTGHLFIQTAPFGAFREPLSLISVGYPVYYAAMPIYHLFGDNFSSARITAVMFLIFFSLFFFLLNKKMYGDKTAILSTLLLLTFAPLYGNGRNLLGDVPGLFFMAAGLIGFLYWEKSGFKKSWGAISAGLGFGLAMATKPNFLVLGGGILLALFFARKQILANIKQFGLFVISGTIPVLWWLKTQFESIEVIQSVLQHYANPYAKESVASLVGPNFVRFFTESTPIHFAIMALTLIVALHFRLRQNQKILGTEVIIYFFIAFTALSYLRTPGWYRYFFLGHIWLIFTFAPSIKTIAENIKLKKALTYGTILVSIVILVQVLHLAKTDLECSESKVDRAATMLQSWVKPDGDILLINVPELTARMPHKQYSQYLEINPRIKYGEEQLTSLKRGGYGQLIIKTADAKLHAKNLVCYEVESDTGTYQFLNRTEDCESI